MADAQHKVSQSAKSFLTINKKQQFKPKQQKVKFVPTAITAPTSEPNKQPFRGTVSNSGAQQNASSTGARVQASKGVANQLSSNQRQRPSNQGQGKGQGAKDSSLGNNRKYKE